ncbi:phage tail assembly protein T [Stenotrophomonas indicatrix]|uniref:phage tail assembly protein T n=2 Tax=Stenotrophomonas TaxID=40323 RepID=UPI003C7DCD96
MGGGAGSRVPCRADAQCARRCGRGRAGKKLIRRPERRLQFRIAWRLGLPHPDHLLAGLTSRQLSEIYAFARVEPMDQPLQDMLAQLTNVLAQVHGNSTTAEDFLLVQQRRPPEVEATLRTQQLLEVFQVASERNASQ